MRGRLLALPLVAGTIGSALLGCSGDTTGTAPTATATTYFGIVLNQHAINLSLTAPTNTIQLATTAFNTNGDLLPDVIQATYRATDSSVTVTPSGVVTAHYVTQPGGTKVIATLQVKNGTYSDSAYIRVTATAPAAGIATFSIQPTAGDSAVGRVGDYMLPTISSIDSAGDNVAFDGFDSGLESGNNFIWFTTSNPNVAQYHAGSYANYFYLVDTGHVTLYANSWVYGVVVKDSLKFKVSWQLNYVNQYDDRYDLIWDKYTMFLGVGGVVTWFYSEGGALDVIFDDST